MSALGSVIIPAHNESAVIERTLAALLKSVGDRNVEMIVVANGCTDDTAERARQYSEKVTVLETEVGSKIVALNLGDEHATAFPRLYLDADIEVSETLIPEMFEALAGDDVRAAWPASKYETSESSMIVSAFYYVWTRLPHNRPGRIGAGIYGLNRSARQRFDDFPMIIADDGFVRGQYDDGERNIVNSCYTIVRAPVTAMDLVKIKTRSRLGVYELKEKHAESMRRHRSNESRFQQLRAILRPDILVRFPIYVAVNLVVRWRASQQLKNLKTYTWERDESTRSNHSKTTVVADG